MTASSGTFALLSLGVLVIGAALGLLSRAILRGRSSMTLAGSVLAGIVGAVIGGLAAHLLSGRLQTVYGVRIITFSVLGTLAVLLVAERFLRHPPPDAEALIAAGESADVEFKSTARINLRTGQRDDRVEMAIAKTLAGFLNTRGGTLLVGVDDSGSVLGLDPDLGQMKSPDLDRYELWLHDFLTRVLSAPAVSLLQVTFPEVGGKAICRIGVGQSSRPVFVRQTKGEEILFFVRLGNSTRQLSVEDAIEYAADHFRHTRRRRPPRG